MPDKKCLSDCREDLIAKIESKVSKGSTLKLTGLAVTIILALWGIGYTISLRGIERRETQIQSNTIAINRTREETGVKLAEIVANIQAIKESQDLLLHTFGIKKNKRTNE